MNHLLKVVDDSGETNNTGAPTMSREKKRVDLKKPHNIQTFEALTAHEQDNAANHKKRKTTLSVDHPRPKRPIPSFVVYANKFRAQVKDESFPNDNPSRELTSKIQTKLGQMWKLASSEEREKCVQEAKKDEDRYTRELKEYKANELFHENNASSAPTAPLRNNKNKVKRSSKEKRKDDLNKEIEELTESPDLSSLAEKSGIEVSTLAKISCLGTRSGVFTFDIVKEFILKDAARVKDAFDAHTKYNPPDWKMFIEELQK